MNDPMAWLTKLGWMIGGRTCPEIPTSEEGRAQMVQGVVAMGQEQVSQGSKCSFPSSVKSLSSIAGGQVMASCGQDNCERDYQDLRRSMQRVWELETEEEAIKLKNRHYPAVMSEKQKKAEVFLRGNMIAVGQWPISNAIVMAQ